MNIIRHREHVGTGMRLVVRCEHEGRLIVNACLVAPELLEHEDYIEETFDELEREVKQTIYCGDKA